MGRCEPSAVSSAADKLVDVLAVVDRWAAFAGAQRI
jgi:hypothetical protein